MQKPNTYIVTSADITRGDPQKIARKEMAFRNHLEHYCAVTIQCQLRRWYSQRMFIKSINTSVRVTTAQEVQALQMDVIEAIPIPELDDTESDESGSDENDSDSESNDTLDDFREPVSRNDASNLLEDYDNDDLSYLKTKLRQLNLLQRTGVIDKMLLKKRQEELLRRHNF